uniref:A-kinase anchor protein 2 C-terminal domain-containing protein n=1 Tax=Leptobrachium leishanense TaxID=445787 RepID=A0A8C5WHW0_9ANUR
MLKYPAPWQVLCGGLERREQVHVNAEAKTLTDELGSSQPDGQNDYEDTSEVITNQNNNEDTLIQYTLTVTEQQVDSEASDSTMDRVTRRQIFSLSSSGNKPTLNEESEVKISTTHEHDQSADDTNKNMQDRDRKLRLLKEDQRFGVRAYLPETSPTKLFAGDEDDDGQPRSREFTPENAKEFERERREIIKKQVQRKSMNIEQISTQQDADTTSSTIDHNGLDNEPDKMNVDRVQINFEAARKQFLQLEKNQNALPISPQRKSRTTRHNYRSINENYMSPEMNEMEDNQEVPLKVKAQQNESSRALEVNGRERSSSLLRKQFFSELPADERDSVREDKLRDVREMVHSPEIPLESENIPNPSHETPIEREIRLALEREESLRKERGIPSVIETKEMVEIVKNQGFLQPSDAQTYKKSKDRSRSAIFLQREIEKEAKREADLKSEGKVAGLYDKGSAQELDERRKLFEQLDDVPVQPQTIKKISRANTVDLDTNYGISLVDGKQTSESTNWTVLDAPLNGRDTSKPMQLNFNRSRRQSADDILDFNQPTYSLEKEAPSAKIVLANFHIQPWKMKLQVKAEEDTEQSPKWTEKARDDTIPVAIYNTRLRPLSRNVIEKEIQETLERDRELQEQRRKSDASSFGTSMDYQSATEGKSDESNRWSAVPRGSKSSDSESPVLVFKPTIVPKFFATESSKSIRNGDDYRWLLCAVICGCSVFDGVFGGANPDVFAGFSAFAGFCVCWHKAK